MHHKDITQATADYDTLGGRIARARAAAGIPASELAGCIGVNEKTINSWESDRSQPRSNRLNMLAGLLGVSATWLLFGRGEAPAFDTTSSMLECVETQLSNLHELHEKTGVAMVNIKRSIEQIKAANAEKLY